MDNEPSLLPYDGVVVAKVVSLYNDLGIPLVSVVIMPQTVMGEFLAVEVSYVSPSSSVS